MANQLLFATSSHSSLLLHLPKPHNPNISLHVSSATPQSPSPSLPFIPIIPSIQRSSLLRTTPTHNLTLRVASKTPPDILTVGLESEGVSVSVDPDTAGGSGGGGFEDLGGGGGGGGDNSGGGGGEGEEESDKGDKDKKKMAALSMSQKLTLGYAALVGVGGIMGYVKSGSQKSLLAGGISSGLLYYVYTQLPSNPTFASSVGLGVSAALLAVMGSRFKKSGKIFPAGVVSLISLIMTGGYLHGILRTTH